jgi:hypothetical protein
MYEPHVRHTLTSYTNHSSESNNFVLDEAFSHELYAEWLVRKKAYRAARHSLKDCISTYRRMSAYGKANHIASKYESLLRGGASLTTVDAAVQTSIVDTGNTAFRLEQNDDNQYMGAETAVDRTKNWIGKYMPHDIYVSLRSYSGWAIRSPRVDLWRLLH